MVHTNTLTVSEFCSSYRISRTHFYNLVKKGLGPQIVKLGRRSLISVDAANRWYEKMASHHENK